MVSDKKSIVIQVVVTPYVMCPCLAAFKIFTLSLVFSSLILLCLDFNFILFILFGVC